MIIPPPGKGSCQNCGYQPDDYTEVAKYAAWEAGKYLGKALDQETTGEDDRGVVKRVKNLTRSKGWPKFVKEKKPDEVCEECGAAHKTTFVGTVEKLAEEYPGLPDEMREVAKEALRVLKPGGHCAVMIGDTRKHLHYIPVAVPVMHAFLEAGFLIREDIIKQQWKTKVTRERWGGGQHNFLRIAHEHLFVFRKPDVDERTTRLKFSKQWW